MWQQQFDDAHLEITLIPGNLKYIILNVESGLLVFYFL
jgi:hypothetical protein